MLRLASMDGLAQRRPSLLPPVSRHGAYICPPNGTLRSLQSGIWAWDDDGNLTRNGIVAMAGAQQATIVYPGTQGLVYALDAGSVWHLWNDASGQWVNVNPNPIPPPCPPVEPLTPAGYIATLPPDHPLRLAPVRQPRQRAITRHPPK